MEKHWTPFWIKGSMFFGDRSVSCPEEWQELLKYYRKIFSENAEQVVLQAVRENLSDDEPAFILEKRREGITLRDWARTQGMFELIGDEIAALAS